MLLLDTNVAFEVIRTSPDPAVEGRRRGTLVSRSDTARCFREPHIVV